MNLSGGNILNNKRTSFLGKKSKRNKLTRELKILEEWMPNEIKPKKFQHAVKKRGRKPKTASLVKTEIKMKEKVKFLFQKDIFKEPIPVDRNKNQVVKNELRRYIIQNITYYNLIELLIFLKFYFKIDYENFVLKDEEKQEFKAKTNDFLKDFTNIYNKQHILIKSSHVQHFFDIIVHFCHIDLENLLKKFYDIFDRTKKEILPEINEFIQPSAFLCENIIRNDESFKKKGGQYLKYKTIPKWHHYAWDMINQISNSRKSFIFSKFIEEDDNENSKKKLDIDTIILKLKLKIYNNIYELIDDMMKMVRYSIEGMQRINNSKNISFCKSIEARLQKHVKKLKEENKI